MRVLLIVCLFCLHHGQGIQKRGVVEEVGKLFQGFSSGFDHFEKAAREEVSKLDSWAETLEREMKPALSRVEDRLGSALDELGFTFGNERIDPHFVETSGK